MAKSAAAIYLLSHIFEFPLADKEALCFGIGLNLSERWKRRQGHKGVALPLGQGCSCSSGVWSMGVPTMKAMKTILQFGTMALMYLVIPSDFWGMYVQPVVVIWAIILIWLAVQRILEFLFRRRLERVFFLPLAFVLLKIAFLFQDKGYSEPYYYFSHDVAFSLSASMEFYLGKYLVWHWIGSSLMSIMVLALLLPHLQEAWDQIRLPANDRGSGLQSRSRSGAFDDDAPSASG